MRTLLPKSSLLRPMLVLVAIVLGTVFLVYSYHASSRMTHGFAMYYTYSRTLLEGGDFHSLYDYSYFNARLSAYGIAGIEDMPNNLPTTSLALLPVAWLSPAASKVAWTVISIILFGLSLVLLFRLFDIRLSDNSAWVLLSLCLGWRPIFDCIALGQVYFLLLFLFTLSVWGLGAKRSLIGGAALSLGSVVKGYGVIPLVWSAVRKQYAFALSAVLFCALIVLGSLPWLGIASWERFATQVVAHLGQRPTDAHVAFQNINGLLFHLFTYDERWIPSPLVVLPTWTVTGLSYALNLAVVLVVFRSAKGTTVRDRVLSYAAMIAVSVVTAPLAEEYHFVLFLPLVVGLGSRWKEDERTNAWPRSTELLFLVSSVALALPLHYKTLQASTFPLILLAYPKLYAGLGVLTTFCLSTRDRENSSAGFSGEPAAVQSTAHGDRP